MAIHEPYAETYKPGYEWSTPETNTYWTQANTIAETKYDPNAWKKTIPNDPITGEPPAWLKFVEEREKFANAGTAAG